MAFNAKVLKVLIASPGDVQEERKEIPNVLRRWNNENGESKGIVLLPVGWEHESYPIYDPKSKGGQSILNEQIVRKADIVIGIFWTRLGTSTKEFASGTVEEIERSALAGKPVSVYFSSANPPYDHNAAQFALVKEYKEKLRGNALTGEYQTLNGFKEQIREHLSPLVELAVQGPTSAPQQSDVHRKSATNWSLEDISRLTKPSYWNK